MTDNYGIYVNQSAEVFFMNSTSNTAVGNFAAAGSTVMDVKGTSLKAYILSYSTGQQIQDAHIE